MSGHTLGVVSVAVCHGRLVTSALDSTIRVFDLSRGDATMTADINVSAMHLWETCFTPDGTHIVAAGGSGSTLDLFTSPTSSSASTSLALSNRVPLYTDGATPPDKQFALSVACSPDGKKAAVGCMDGTVAVVDLATQRTIHLMRHHVKPVRTVRFTHDGRHILSGSDDAYINMCDVGSGELVHGFSGHASWVLSLDVHPEETVMVSGGADHQVKLWDLQTRSCMQTETMHQGYVWSTRFSPDGKRLASAGEDGCVCVYAISR